MNNQAANFFEDIKPFPGEAAGVPAHNRHHNEPPLAERLAMEFEEVIAKEGLGARIQDLRDSGARMPEEIADEATASKVADFVAMIRAAVNAVEAERQKHNRPLLDAQKRLIAKRDEITAPLGPIDTTARARLNAFMAEKRRKEAEAARKAEEARRAAEEAARKAAEEAKGDGEAPAPMPKIEAAPVVREKVKTDMGATLSTRTVWQGAIAGKVRGLPDRILENEKVREAVERVINAEVRAGTREIKGARIWSEEKADIR